MKALSINETFWIGMSEIRSEGNWVWVNGETATSSELIWSSGQPDNYRNIQDCGALFTSGYADDDTCTRTLFGLCEKKI